MFSAVPASPLARTSVRAAAVALAGLGLVLSASRAAVHDGSGPAAPGSDLFQPGAVHLLRIRVATVDLDSLRQNPRRAVGATLEEAGLIHSNLSLHLKGRTGSFRPLDDKPGFTLHFHRGSNTNPPGVWAFHGLTHIHLNNSVEDPSYLNEALGARLFGDAGLPAPRVGHVRIELNDRPLGLYVLKEGFSKEFLAQHFRRTDGNLYEHVPSAETGASLRRASGRVPKDTSDLTILATALGETNLHRRWERLQAIVDVDTFLTFLAMEVMVGHRDGYALAANNYRIYHNPDTERLVWLPQGMDQLFGRSDLPVVPSMSGPAGRALLEIPAGRRAYRDRAATLLTNLFLQSRLDARARDLTARLASSAGRAEAEALHAEGERVRKRIAARIEGLTLQLAQPEPSPLQVDRTPRLVEGWHAAGIITGGKLDEAPSPDLRPAWHIRAAEAGAGSWRATVLLEAGRYRFEALARIAGVQALERGRNRGAGIRVSGVTSSAPYDLLGDSDWTLLATEFEVPPAGAVMELVCELRARQGEAWFDRASLKLSRVQP